VHAVHWDDGRRYKDTIERGGVRRKRGRGRELERPMQCLQPH